MIKLRGLVSFILRRILFSIGVLFGVAFVTFVISRVIVPNPARVWAGPRASPETIAAFTTRFHLNDPFYIQFYYYLNDLLHGNWGVSPSSGQPVLYSISIYLPATIELTIAAILLTIIIGIPLGVVAATNKDKALDHVSRVVSLSGVASPPFLAALLLQLIFFYYLRLVPDSGGRISLSVTPPPNITGLFTVDSLITGNWPAFVSSIEHLILPSFALAFLILGLMSRLVRASMLEALTSDYVRTAKAKGLAKRWVIYKHALRNAFTQPITALSIYVAYTLGGSVVIESIFSWPGVGRYAAQAALVFDLPAVMGTTLVFTLGVVFANLVADILLAVIDPRIRLG
jgi:peptide/nickel transport system permease protein